MTTIRILPEILSNKIAAGEVVERPAAVVKELVENALDAGSTRILIDVGKGGRALIRVADNGSGMSRDDALLSIERYATSKLKTEADLFAIRTLGFRGEALPSIAAVSRFSLVSRPAGADAGTAIEIEAGKLLRVSEIGAPPGTMVTVKQLFYNTPARRKFLKTDATEMGHIADTAAAIALVQPAVQFRLDHNGRTVKNWPATDDAALRIADVLGRDLKPGLHAIGLEAADVAVSGWIALPAFARKSTRGMHVFVNGRHVRDRTVQHALLAGYAQRLVKGQFPVAAVFICVPFDQVDVNVHPAKSAVRFARQRSVHDAVRRAVAQTLYEVDRPRWAPQTYELPGAPVGRTGRRLAESRAVGPASDGWQPFGTRPCPRAQSPADNRPPPAADQLSPPAPEPAPTAPGGDPAARPQRAVPGSADGFAQMRPIGQLANTYIVCEGPGGLVLIDQHAAHERILFEQLCRQSPARPGSQKLLVAETIELGFREAAALAPVLPELAAFGLDIEPFGGNTVVVKAVPAVLSEREIRPLVVALAEQAAQLGSAAALTRVLDACRMVVACHGAIRARQPLDDRQVNALLGQLDACDNPSHCPHGRPTWVRWDLTELDKMFKRIV